MKRLNLRFRIAKELLAGMYWYLLPLCICWAIFGLLLVLHGKTGSFSLFNSYPTETRDRVLSFLTELSSGIVLVSIFILALCRSRPVETILGVSCVFIAWYVCITIKYNVFADWKSPERVFGAAHIHLLKSHLQPELNFPSAHAAIIAALSTYLAWFYRGMPAKLCLILFIAMFLTILHIFAGWAFVDDVLAGSILGTVCCLLSIWWLHKRIARWYEHRNYWWQGIIIAIFRTTAICLLLFSLKYVAL